jgi:hypothetical protein
VRADNVRQSEELMCCSQHTRCCNSPWQTDKCHDAMDIPHRFLSVEERRDKALKECVQNENFQPNKHDDIIETNEARQGIDQSK